MEGKNDLLPQDEEQVYHPTAALTSSVVHLNPDTKNSLKRIGVLRVKIPSKVLHIIIAKYRMRVIDTRDRNLCPDRIGTL